MPYSTTAVFVKKDDTLRFRHTAPNDWGKTDTVIIRIGKTNATWSLTTIDKDETPDPFSFIDVDNAELATTYTYADGLRIAEQIVNISGLSVGTQVGVYFTVNVVGATVADYALEITKQNGVGSGVWFLPNASTRVENGDKVKIRVKSSASNGATVSALLVIGNSSARWTIKTKLRLRNIPNPFPGFGNITGQPLSTYIYSNVVQILGLSSSPVTTQVIGTDSFVGISSTNATTTDANGFSVLSGATFASSTGSISNGQYMQLKARSGAVRGDIKSFGFAVAEGSTANGDGSVWQVSTTTQIPPSPTNFSFVNKFDQAINSLIESEPAPAITATNPTGGISGLGAGVSVPVTLVSPSTEVKIKINDGSIGIFPASVKNGDFITLYARSSSSISTEVAVIIQVGSLSINPWRVSTTSGPDGIPDPLTAPPNLIGVVPDTYQTSAPVIITGINIPVDITVTSGTLISIDYDTAVPGPRQFDPATNTSFRIVLKSSINLSTPQTTTVTVSTAAPFTWSVTTYLTAPVGRGVYKSAWYSKKNEQRSGQIVAPAKYDGYSVGTIIPVLKETVSATPYGTNLTGGRDSRFPGFVYCYGQTLLVKDYLELFLTIGNTYGGSGNYTAGTSGAAASATGDFKLPNYRNRRMCGTGVVDGNNSSSVFLGVTGGVGGSGTYNTVGQEGGYWYVDKVGTAGSPPEEQATGPTTSNFFTLGTVKTTGADLVTDDAVTFNVTGGALGATVGPLFSIPVTPPEHDHYYISAVTESDGDEPYLKWDVPTLFYVDVMTQVLSLPYTTPSGGNAESDKIASSLITNVTNMRNLFRLWLSNRGLGVGSQLDSGLQLNTGNFNSIQKIIDDLSAVGNKTYSYANYWPSPESGLPGASSGLLRATSGGFNCAGVIDTEEDSFSVTNFQTTDGTSTASHSHFLSPNRIIDPTTDFSYDDVSGAGGQGALRVGLGSQVAPGSPGRPETTLQITFNQSDVQMSCNEGTFELNTTTKIPKPSYRIEPQSTVPVITEFHKVRYMIKAF